MPLEIRGTLFNSECTISAGNTLRIGPDLTCYNVLLRCRSALLFSSSAVLERWNMCQLGRRLPLCLRRQLHRRHVWTRPLQHVLQRRTLRCKPLGHRFSFRPHRKPKRGQLLPMFCAELSMGWIDLWVGLGQDFSLIVGWVGSTTAKVLKFERIVLMHLKHG